MLEERGDTIFDVEAIRMRLVKAGASLRPRKPPRRPQEYDDNQLDLFAQPRGDSAHEAPQSAPSAVEAPHHRSAPSAEEDDGSLGVTKQPGPSSPFLGTAEGHALLHDYRITAESKVGVGSVREKAEFNLDAIRLLKTIERDGRKPTSDEKHILARYTGWGAMPRVFDYFTGRRDDWSRVRDSVRELLTAEEYNTARASVPNAHFTSPLVVEAIWQALERLGLASGARILEPSCGSGNFFGLIPEQLLPDLTRVGVEKDSITARIAKALYGSATIYEAGFEEAPLPDGHFDVALGNVPFGNYGVHDPRYRAWQTASIHNYFFVGALDKLREGGLLAFITSRFTMDGKDSAIRDHLAGIADLLGAIRLPNTSFKANAGTVVTTDIIFLQKRPTGRDRAGPNWQSVETYTSPRTSESFAINEYYVCRPAMMLGAMEQARGAFGIQPELVGELTREALHAAIEAGLPHSVYHPRIEPCATRGPPTVLVGQQDLDAVKNGAYVVIDGILRQRQENEFKPVSRRLRVEARIRGMIRVRDAVREVFRTQLSDAADSEIVTAREELGRVYDRYLRDFGCLSSRENRLAFADDPDAPLLLSLEESYDDIAGTARKAAIFHKRTLERYRPIERVETAAEALAVVLNEFGRIDWPRMSALTGRSESELRDELGHLVYQNPETDEWETADRYLSGNVRQKLAAAHRAAKLKVEFQRNAAALTAVQPEDLGPDEITARFGATWIPPDDIADFIAQIIDADAEAVRVDYVADLSAWMIAAKDSVKLSVCNVTTFGTSRFTALELIDDALNGKASTAYDLISVDGQEKRVVNERQTLEAREMQQKLKDRFSEWIWAEPECAARLAGIYNEKFNSQRLRAYDGSHLSFPGMNKSILRDNDLAPHQKNAVWRILQGDSTLLAHCVGAGKTWTMTAAAMEAKRIGLSRKSMVVVPNHLVEQWGTAFLQLYPQAAIFVAGKDHFQSGKRERAMSRIATGDYDAVIVSHRSFEQLPVSDGLFDRYLNEELDSLDRAIADVSEGAAGAVSSRRVVKTLETARNRLAKRIEDRASREKKDNAITFEELGIDRIFVDEADLYKNLGFATKMNRIAGLPQTTSNRATDMHLKTRWLRERNNGKGVVFATGTPISNTMAELYTMQRYLAPQALADAGLAAFDAWAANFGEAVTSLELAPSGAGYRMHTRFAKFVNLPELLTMFRDFADVQTPEMLNLPRPALKGGRNRILTAPSTPDLKAFVDALIVRAEKIRGGNIDPSDDNMLKITSEGRKAALDMRLVDSTAEDHPRSKLSLVRDEIFKIWRDTTATRATQLAFCDISTPQPGRFHVYGAIRTGLIERGVPACEIAYIHEAETDAQKQALFDKVNSGVVRILLGSTEKMGAGTNVQRKLFASHNIDAPWRPRDIEQRDGRILRQGNEHAEVLIYRYVTEGSFDAYMWQTLETKARFIQQVMNGNVSVRTAEDVGGGALTYAEIKAIASGNPAVMEKVKVDAEVRKLDSLRSSYLRRQFDLRGRIAPTQSRIASSRDHLSSVEKDIETRDANETEGFSIMVAGQIFSGKGGREAASQALNDAIYRRRADRAPTKCAHFGGLDVLSRGEPDGSVSAFLRGAATYNVNFNPDNPIGTLMSLERTLSGLEAVRSRLEEDILRDEKAVAEYKLQIETPFEHETRLTELLAEQVRLNAALDLDKDDRQATTAVSDADADRVGTDRLEASDRPEHAGASATRRGVRLATVELG